MSGPRGSVTLPVDQAEAVMRDRNSRGRRTGDEVWVLVEAGGGYSTVMPLLAAATRGLSYRWGL